MEPLKPGSRIDSFRVETELYAGAMARIYKCRDLLSDEVVALKVPFGDIINNPILYYHYQNEERIGRLLNHPHIVRFLYRNRSSQYIIQEYLPGRDLRSLIGRNRTMEFSMARRHVLQICRALRYMHAQGVIHLDLKPENMILSHGRLKIIDFGLAVKKGMPDLLGQDFTAPHGTPYYIAPEQLLGIRTVPASDMYALGVMLFEMLTGELPYPRSKKLSTTRLRLKAAPVPPRYYRPDFDAHIQEIILRMLSMDPAKRYGSIPELIDDLRHPQQVEVTELGRRTRRPLFFLARLRPSATLVRPENDQENASSHPRQILAAIIDDDEAHLVVEEARRLVLLDGGEVTLLTVLEEADDSHFLMYGQQVAGERLRTRLESFVQRLRRYSIDPTVRLIRGRAATVIVELARQLDAEKIILGPSRSKGLWQGSVLKQVMKKFPDRAMSADPDRLEYGWSISRKTISRLRREEVIDFDIFLVDAWFDHLSWLADLALALLPGHDATATADLDESCLVGRWLARLEQGLPCWRGIANRVRPVHEELHGVAQEMVRLGRNGEYGAMKHLYQARALPLSCRLQRCFADTSKLVRDWSGAYEIRPVPVLLLASCPLLHRSQPVGGPLLELHTIRSFLETGHRDIQAGEGP